MAGFVILENVSKRYHMGEDIVSALDDVSFETLYLLLMMYPLR